VQLRGVNISALEFVAIGAPSWANRNPWGAQTGDPTPNWQAIKAWKANAVRLPLNEASWLGYSCVDRHGNSVNPDPWGNYQATIKQAVSEAVAAGLYVIVDLHWTAPSNLCPLSQDQLPDADHSIAFWTSLANTFKHNPAVIFDLFNEPYGASNDSPSDWRMLRDGGPLSVFSSDSGHSVLHVNWQAVGMQTLVNTVRATGATNIVMVAGLGGASDIANWLSYRPSDPLNQLALSWHAYSGINTKDASYAAAVIAAGVPVIIGETGDKSANGTVSAPVISQVTSWADQNGASVLAWAWDRWNDSNGNPGTQNLLIKDAAGTPTDGEGVTFKAWLASRH
jgi:endoglucanase